MDQFPALPLKQNCSGYGKSTPAMVMASRLLLAYMGRQKNVNTVPRQDPDNINGLPTLDPKGNAAPHQDPTTNAAPRQG